jgi:hypothetical protein
MLHRIFWSSLAGLAATIVTISCAGAGPAASRLQPVTAESGPIDPPRARYVIDCQIDPGGTLKGTETVEFVNTTRQPLSRLAVAWSRQADPSFRIETGGRPVTMLDAAGDDNARSLVLVDFASPVQPGASVTLKVAFTRTFRLDRAGRVILLAWHPRVWWGRETHDDFSVKTSAPSGYVLGASAPLDPATGRYSARGVRSFGIVLAQGHEVMETKAGDVVVRAIHTKAGAECARLLLATAADAIQFYRNRFGFYPQQSFTIIPGGDAPVGGYPVATGIVVVHGQEKFDAKKPAFWKWITAHEIGHQYWLEHVLSADQGGGWGWLMIGLGIYADREYSRTRGLAEQHREFFDEYIDAVRKGIDTTVDLTPEQMEAVTWDFNNIVTHGKGFCIISAFEVTLGRDAFDRIYRRCLHEYAGRPLGAPAFQVICEREIGGDLGWFFSQWVRSNRYLSYAVTGRSSEREGAEIVTSVSVKRLGTLAMPVPVVAEFPGGVRQVRFTDRRLATQTVTFRSAVPPSDVRIDPDGNLPMVVPPPEPSAAELSLRIARLSFGGSGDDALEIYPLAIKAKLAGGSDWFRLGLMLYEGRHDEEALRAFQEASRLSSALFIAQTALVWQGHVLDLLGRRDEALRCYRSALDKGFVGPMRHDQWGMVLDRKWVEERLVTPFTRK